MPHWAKEPKDRKKVDKVDYVLGSKHKLPAPPLGSVSASTRGGGSRSTGGGADGRLYFDANASLVSRLYDRDRDRVIQRARSDGVVGALCWHPDIEKVEDMRKLCSMNESWCYFMTGIHPDNISRTSKTQQEAWHLKVDEYSRERNCVAVYSGLNVTRRDIQSHFAQESMLRCLYQQAKSLGIPLVILVESREAEPKPGFDVDVVKAKRLHTNLSRVTEVLEEEGWRRPDSIEDIPVIIQDAIAACRGEADVMNYLIATGYYVSISLNDLLQPRPMNTDGCDGEEEGGLATVGPIDVSIAQCLAEIPHNRLLLGSNSPHGTPQNIADTVIRTSKNEPSNFKYMVQYLAPLFQITEEELASINLENCKLIFKIGEADESATKKSPEGEDQKAGATTAGLDVADGLAGLDISPTEDLSQCYACTKCASVLFSASQLNNRHPIVADSDSTVPLTVFQQPEGVADAGGADTRSVQYCDAVYFLPFSFLDLGSSSFAKKLMIDSKCNVSCASCSTKLGKQQGGAEGEVAACPCGHAVDCAEGGVLRLSSTKIQLHSNAVGKTKAKLEIKEEDESTLHSHGFHGSRKTHTKDKDNVGHSDVAADGKQSKGGHKKGKSTRKNH